MRRSWFGLAAILATGGCGGLVLEGGGGDGGSPGVPDASASTDVMLADREGHAETGVDGASVDVEVADAGAIDSGPRTLVALAKGQCAISGLAVDSTHVYWSTYWPTSGEGAGKVGTIMKVPIDGGTATQLATASLPLYPAVESTNLYWSQGSQDAGPFAELSIMSIPIDGGTATQLVPASNANCIGMAVGPSGVYWAGDAWDYGILSVPLAGGTVSTVAQAPGAYTGVALDSTNVYWTYIDSTRTGSVMARPLAGGPPVTIASGPEIVPDYESVSVNSTGIYWGARSGIQGRLKGGGSVTTIAVRDGPYDPPNMTVDETDVYWLHSSEVMKAPLSGGPAVTLAMKQDSPRGIVVDGTSVYWGTGSQTGSYLGNIMKLTPK